MLRWGIFEISSIREASGLQRGGLGCLDVAELQGQPPGMENVSHLKSQS